MKDEALNILLKQLQQTPLGKRRTAAAIWLELAYKYTEQWELTDEKYSQILFLMNYAVGLSKNSTRQQLRTEIAYACDILKMRKTNSATDSEQKLINAIEELGEDFFKSEVEV